MNQFLSIMLPAPAGNAARPTMASAPSTRAAASVDVAVFRAQFAQRLKTANGASLDASGALAANESSDIGRLEKTLAARLKAGDSLAGIIAELAASLAASIAQQLGLTDADARLQLQTAFASALAPPGPPGQPLAPVDGARALAQRFAGIANAAARAASSAPGQLNRIVGDILDAEPAKDTPAQAPLTKLAGAPVPPPLTASVPIAAAAASDGRSVSTNPAQTVATGGDTPLGRILARAANAAEDRQSAVAETGGPSLPGVAIARPLPGSVVATFLQSFASALATRADAGERANANDEDGAPAPAEMPAFAPVVPPFAVETTQTAPQSATASAPHPAATDANAVVDQVLRGAFMRNLGQSTEMRLQLVPEHLGDVTVKLVIDGGTVNAHVVAQTADVRDALLGGQSQLTKSLSDAGLKLASFTVDVANNGFAGFARQQQQSHERPSFGRRVLLGGSPADDGGDDALQAIPSFGPPLLASADLGALDYLV